MMIRSLAIVAALCLFGTSASALTMEECRAKYKAEKAAEGPALPGLIIRKSVAALTPRPLRRNQPLPRSIDVRPPQLAASFICRCDPMSPVGTFETCPPILRMSVRRGRPEVAWPTAKPTRMTRFGRGHSRTSAHNCAI